jgi:hypothetical protein
VPVQGPRLHGHTHKHLIVYEAPVSTMDSQLLVFGFDISSEKELTEPKRSVVWLCVIC